MKTAAVAVLLVALPAAAAPGRLRPVKAESVPHVHRPTPREPTPERLRSLEVPPGFQISVFAKDLKNARMLAVADDGAIYLTRRAQGDVLLLRDADGDGRADEIKTVFERPDAHGIALRNGEVYIATVRELFVAKRRPDGTLEPARALVRDLPHGGQHPNRTLGFAPDGSLFISIGSTCNACEEKSPEHATILRAPPDFTSRKVFARGLRNTVGFAWHPETGELWGMDHGIDWLGDDKPVEELNRITEGAHYGWPYLYGDNQRVPSEVAVGTQASKGAALVREAVPPVLGYVAHAAPMQLAFYTGRQFPAEYRNDAFVAMRGSWNRKPPSGYEVVRVRFQDGRPTRFEPFVTGFLVDGGVGYLGRPCGVAVAPDGALLVSDDSNGVLYRVAWVGAN